MKTVRLFFCLLSGLLLAAPAQALMININPGAGLNANAAALAAFNRAADRWEGIFSDPIVVNIDADLQALGAGILGQASSVLLAGDYDLVRDAMVVDATDEAGNGVVQFLPDAAGFSALLPTGFGLTGDLAGTKASLKALGFAGLDAVFGTTDATITFSDTVNFDFDNSDGVTAGFLDFETVAVHEIGHALGFTSIVDAVDSILDQGLTANVTPHLLDLFRFDPSSNPASNTDFNLFARDLVPGGIAFFDDLTDEYAFSTGRLNGDGRQASHWKDNELTGTLIGVLDPTLGAGQVFAVSPADIRALDLIGFDLIEMPGPAAWPLFATGLVALGWLRRRGGRRSATAGCTARA